MRALWLFILSLMLATPALAQDVEVSLSTAPDGTRTLVHEVVIPADIDSVWTAVATLEGWRTWATPVARDVPGGDRFETSYNPAAVSGGSDTIEHEWLSRHAPRHVSYRTTRTPQGFPHAEAYLQTRSDITLTAEGPNATRVRLAGENYPAGAEGDALISFFREGNRMALQMLHQRFTTGPLDWAAMLAGS